MHPIERLRYVARSSGAPQAVLVRETAAALGALGFDPAGLVTACRRVLDRHPTSGALWWLAARVLTTVGDPDEEGWRCADEIDDDTTVDELAAAFPNDAVVCVLGWPELVGEALARRGDVEVLAIDALDEGSGLVRRLRHAGVDASDVPVTGMGAAVAAADLMLLEASATGPDAVIAVSGSRAAAAVARHAGVPVWVIAGVGRRLPAALFGALLDRLAAEHGGEPWEVADEVVPVDLIDRVCGPSGLADVDALRVSDCPVAAELLRAGAAALMIPAQLSPSPRQSWRTALIVLVVVAVLVAAGVAGWSLAGDDDDTSAPVPREGRQRDEGLTVDANAESFEFDAVGEVGPPATPFQFFGEFVDLDHWRLVMEMNGGVIEQIRDGGDDYVRIGSTEDELDGAPWFELVIPDVGGPFGIITPGLVESFAEEATPAIVLFALIESVLLDPSARAEIVLNTWPSGIRRLNGERGYSMPIDVPASLSDDLDSAGFVVPDVEAVVVLDRRRRPERLTLDVASEAVNRVDVEYRDWGEAVVTPPDPSEVTPIEEDPIPPADAAGLASIGTGLVAPADTRGLVLFGIEVLTAEETVESCPQAHLIYESPLDSADYHFVEIFLLPRSCAEAFDPAPFDETFGGLPSRFDSYEVLVGDTVVQLLSDLPPEELAALAASLAPIPAEQLLAQVED